MCICIKNDKTYACHTRNPFGILMAWWSTIACLFGVSEMSLGCFCFIECCYGMLHWCYLFSKEHYWDVTRVSPLFWQPLTEGSWAWLVTLTANMAAKIAIEEYKMAIKNHIWISHCTFNPHRSRELVSPVCGIFFIPYLLN